MEAPELRTERLRLRQVRLVDAPAIQRWFAHWSIIEHLSSEVPWPYPDDGAETFVREIALPQSAAGEALHWAITLAEAPDELIGSINFLFTDTGLGNRGFWLAEHLWGQGLMTEAVEAVQDHLFFELKLDRIVVFNAAENAASRRVKEKTGGRRVGTKRIEHVSGFSDSDAWEITRADWTQLRKTN